jgi:hypothetical protein
VENILSASNTIETALKTAMLVINSSSGLFSGFRNLLLA